MFKTQTQTSEALWICDSCDTWWGSEPAATRPEEWRDHCPSWLVTGLDPSMCPECGWKMAKRPLPVSPGAARMSLN
jgi:hypothetical protein